MVDGFSEKFHKEVSGFEDEPGVDISELIVRHFNIFEVDRQDVPRVVRIHLRRRPSGRVEVLVIAKGDHRLVDFLCSERLQERLQTVGF